MSRSRTGLPSSSSRIAPPTIHASSPASTSRAASSIDDLSFGALGARLDPGRDLVVDRPGVPRVLFDEEAVPDDRHRLALRQLAWQLDREGVHRDGPDRAAALAGDQHFRAGEVAAETVPVADR